MRRPLPRRFFLAASVAVAAALIGIAFAARNLVSSQEGTGTVDFTKITPEGLGIYTEPTPNYPPDLTTLPTCQAPADERPDPDLPPLSCRYSGAEPPPGSINTPSPEEVPDPTAVASNAPAGWTVIDNRLFRYTIAIPPGWYSDMRTEGGEFRAFHPVALEQERGGKDLPGGILIRFTARAVITNLPPNRQFWPDVERHLAEANTQFGSYAGVVWTESIEESVTETIHAAFARDNVAYEIRANLGVGSGSDVIDNGRDVVTTILTTLEPY